MPEHPTDPNTPCVKCGYQGQPRDDVLHTGTSAAACPRCGLLYEKATAYLDRIQGKTPPDEDDISAPLVQTADAPCRFTTSRIIGALVVLLIVTTFFIAKTLFITEKDPPSRRKQKSCEQ